MNPCGVESHVSLPSVFPKKLVAESINRGLIRYRLDFGVWGQDYFKGGGTFFSQDIYKVCFSFWDANSCWWSMLISMNSLGAPKWWYLNFIVPFPFISWNTFSKSNLPPSTIWIPNGTIYTGRQDKFLSILFTSLKIMSWFPSISKSEFGFFFDFFLSIIMSSHI